VSADFIGAELRIARCNVLFENDLRVFMWSVDEQGEIVRGAARPSAATGSVAAYYSTSSNPDTGQTLLDRLVTIMEGLALCVGNSSARDRGQMASSRL
jgi:hypothetical protein